ncbi:MAG: hypothetical protein ACJ8AD_06395 [Gemmatimonadaceae bacterium]
MRHRAYRVAYVAIAALMSSAPPSAHAQTPVYAASASAASDTTFDRALVRDIELAAARGIPAAPLLAKVREGRLKRAPNPRIRLAVAALAARLDTARAALGANATADELVAGADALSAGASAAALRAVRAATPARAMTASLGALAQLVASGVPTQRAVSMIVELLRRNPTPAQVLAFGNSVEADAAGGVPAEESAVFRLHGISPTGQSTAADAAPALSQPGALSNQAAGSGPRSTRPPTRRP